MASSHQHTGKHAWSAAAVLAGAAVLMAGCGSAASAAATHPSAANVSALDSALSGVKTSVQPVTVDMKAACPGS